MNLNVTSETRAPVERFDPRRPQGHNPTLYQPSFGTLLVMIGAGVTIAGMLLFGVVTLANGGEFPQAKTMMRPYEKYVAGDKTGEQRDEKGQLKTDEEQLKDLLERYVSDWNGGRLFDEMASNVYGRGMSYKLDKDQAKGTDIVSHYEPTTRITAAHLDNYALLSDTKAQGEATFVLFRRQPLSVWDERAKTKPEAEKVVVIEQAVRYALTLEKQDGDWHITEQNWLDKTPARIKEESDQDAEAFPIPEGDTGFTEKRPTREAMQARYESMASNFGLGIFPADEAFADYTLRHTAGGDPLPGKGRGLNEVAARLKKLRSQASELSFMATVEGVSQLSENRAIVVVIYRMNIKTSSGNEYTATWQDRDTWATAQESNNWYLLETQRPQPSPLRGYFGL